MSKDASGLHAINPPLHPPLQYRVDLLDGCMILGGRRIRMTAISDEGLDTVRRSGRKVKPDLHALGVAPEVEAVDTERLNDGNDIIGLLGQSVTGRVMRLVAPTVTARINQHKLEVIP